MANKIEKITVEIYPPGTDVWFVDVYEDTVLIRHSKVEDVQIYKNGIFYDLGDATGCASQHVVFPELGGALAHAREWWDSKFGKEAEDGKD